MSSYPYHIFLPKMYLNLWILGDLQNFISCANVWHILILINSYDFGLKIRKFPKYDGNRILHIFHGFYNFESSKTRNYGSEHVSTLPST